MKIIPGKTDRAVTLLELLCVLAIIAILMAFYLPAMSRAFKHAKEVLFGIAQ